MRSRVSLFAICLVLGFADTVPAPATARQPNHHAKQTALPARVEPCPSDGLSCGKQKPVQSDGVHPFTNEEMGLSVVFPRGALVCKGRSGDAPRGFYSWLGTPTNCSERVPRELQAYLGIYSSYNALDWTSPRQAFLTCKPLPPLLSRRLRHAKLESPGHRSAVCQRKTKDGIELTVTALAGPKCNGVPTVEYDAFLGTTWRRFDMDLKRFQSFLNSAKIGTPNVRC